MITISYTDEVYTLLDKIFSCLIYRGADSTYDENLAIVGFRELMNVVKLEELRGDYLALYLAFQRQEEIKTYRQEYPFKLSKDIFISSLEIGIENLLETYPKNFKCVLEELDLSTDLSIDLNMEQACSGVIGYLEERFRDILEIEVLAEDVLAYIQELVILLEELLCKQCTITMSEILMEGVSLSGKFYKGVEGYKKFVNIIPIIQDTRFGRFLADTDSSISVTTMEEHKNFMLKNKDRIKKICDFGFEPLDDVACICNSDVVTLIGDEGVGKTNAMIRFACQVLLTGKDVLIMAGETLTSKAYHMILSHLLYRTRGLRVSPSEVMHSDSLPENIQKMLNQLALDMVERKGIGRVHIQKEFSYEGCYREIEGFIKKYPEIAMVAIDHTDRLVCTGDITSKGYLRSAKERVDFLYSNEINLSDKYPLFFLNIAHTSSEATKLLARGKEVGVRSGSSSGNTSKDADIVLLLSKTMEGNTDEFVKLSVKKMRNFSDAISPFLLMKDFTCCNFIYDKQYQYKIDDDEDIDEEDLD